MESFTKINLNEVKDAAKDFGFAGNHEARFPSKELGLTQSGIGYEIVYPGKHIPFGHTHNNQEELYVIISGSGHVKIDDQTLAVQPLDAIRISSGANRSFKAGDDDKLVIIVFGAPKTAEPDANMLEDPWSDQ